MTFINGRFLLEGLSFLLSFSCAKEEEKRPEIESQAGVETPSPIIGKLKFFLGEVKVFKGGSWKQVSLGTELANEDSILTGADSEVEISLEDGRTIKVKPNTREVLSNLTFSAEEKRLAKEVTSRIKRLAKGEKDTTGVPTATAGIRAVPPRDDTTKAKPNTGN